jgi:hypothetical protein
MFSSLGFYKSWVSYAWQGESESKEASSGKVFIGFTFSQPELFPLDII